MPYQRSHDVSRWQLDNLRQDARAIKIKRLQLLRPSGGDEHLGVRDAHASRRDGIPACGRHFYGFAETNPWSVGRAGVLKEHGTFGRSKALVQFAVVALFGIQYLRALRGDDRRWATAVLGGCLHRIAGILVGARGQAPGQQQAQHRRRSSTANWSRSPTTCHGPSLWCIRPKASHTRSLSVVGSRCPHAVPREEGKPLARASRHAFAISSRPPTATGWLNRWLSGRTFRGRFLRLMAFG